MTTTESQLTGTSLETSRWPISRVLVGFIVGVLLVAIVAVGSVLAYEQTYAGKIAVRRLGRWGGRHRSYPRTSR